MWSAAGRWLSEQRQRSTRCGTRAWRNSPVAPSQALSLMRGGRLTRWSGVFCVVRRFPHEEKVFSIFEGHTRWISKGKAGTPVELGVPVALIEDQYGFILHHEVLWEGEDVDVAVPMVKQAQVLYPELRACSFDRGFHSPANRVGLDALLDVNAVAGQGLSFEGQPRAGSGGVVCGRAASASGD